MKHLVLLKENETMKYKESTDLFFFLFLPVSVFNFSKNMTPGKFFITAVTNEICSILRFF